MTIIATLLLFICVDKCQSPGSDGAVNGSFTVGGIVNAKVCSVGLCLWCVVDDPCALPIDVGSCEGQHPHYFYDQSSDTCQLFYFSGCQGNANRFSSLEDCETKCRRTPPLLTTTAPHRSAKKDICYLPNHPGSCKDQQVSHGFPMLLNS